MNKINCLLLGMATLAMPMSVYAQELKRDFSFPEPITTVGRGDTRIENGVLKSKGSYALFGEPSWKDYTVSFKARAPKDAEQVQIWAGFRTHNRFDRYVLGIKGGLQDDLYLMRTGYMGTDEFMGVRPLGFHPEPGEWIKVKVEVAGNRIRVFLNDEMTPYIDVEDKNGPESAPCGEIALGGGWIETEFDDLEVTPLSPAALKDVKVKEYKLSLSKEEKESKRKAERSAYKGKYLESLNPLRTELSLDGDWLFMPTYQVEDESVAVSPATDDNDWHVMNVPDFWSPIRIWLHGETMPAPNGQEHKGVSDTYYQRETDRCENYTFDYRQTKAAWYRQWIDLPADIKGKQLTLQFDAVSKVAEVYINGEKAADHIGMFGSFDVDVTPYLKPGRNLIAIRVTRDIKGMAPQTSDAMENYYASVRKDVDDNKNDDQANREQMTDVPHGFFGDNPAGIWQPVKLIVSNPTMIEDVFIQPSLTGADFELEIKNNDPQKRRSFNVNLAIIDKKTGESLYSGEIAAKQQLSAGARDILKASVSGLNPKLWSPEDPNLYDFKFSLVDGKKEIDSYDVVSGFRTFESKDGYLYLNGKKYWLRGGNHIPFSLGMNNVALADKFMSLMKEGNVNSTRTHTTPWNHLWMEAADRNGIAVSFEGTWPWLMIHSTPIPEQKALDLWKYEWLQVMKNYRNHPSLVFWTINNEMKFYDLDADKDRAWEKMNIISDVVKDMRETDPSRPISFDSNYTRRNGVHRFGEDKMKLIDDGDIDDNHAYYNWYDFSVFRFFNGEFEKNNLTPGRPLISQEMSTGYPNAETGHPTRSYQLIHQNPFSLVGYEAYDFKDPASFLKVQSFITGELAETLRRTSPLGSGIMHFSYMTWFKEHYDADKIQGWPTYFAMTRAMQPILVSAELWGRNFYAGDKIHTRFYVVNDSEDARDLSGLTVDWKIKDSKGGTLASGSASVPDVEYYGRQYIEQQLPIPAGSIGAKEECTLTVDLKENGKVVSSNHYDINIADRSWNNAVVPPDRKITLLADDKTVETLSTAGIPFRKGDSVLSAIGKKKNVPELIVISGLDGIAEDEATALRDYQKAGGKLLFLNCKEVARQVYPEYIQNWIIPTEGDIVVVERDDDPVFDDLGVLDLRYFNNNKREIPTACHATLKAVRNENVKELASQMKIHAYIDGGAPEDRMNKIESMRGLTLLEIADGNGRGMVSTIATDKADTDPIAGHMLTNMVKSLLR